MILIGIVGKANAGKSSFFKAVTLLDVKIADYPFTTIEPNRAVGYVTSECPCKNLKIRCNPKNSQCLNGTRLIPVELMDVAGLVPGAHLGRGMGNKFLDDLRRANVLIHVLDCSGTTDENGRKTVGYNPILDVEWLENEIDEWIYEILKKSEKPNDVKAITKQLTGLGISEENVKTAYEKTRDLRKLSTVIRKISKPILIAANKMDLPDSRKGFEMIKKFPDRIVIPCSAEYEIALRLAAKNNIIEYFPGSNSFAIKDEEKINPSQKEALEKIKSFLNEFGSTGIQHCLNAAVFNLLNYIVIYPVENENNLSDSKGNVLPDACLVPNGTTAKQFAGYVHSDFEKNFIFAVDARTKMRVSSSCVLKNNDIIKIVSGK